MAGSSVVGLGAGVILLLILWTVTAIAWVQLSQKQSALRIIVTILSILLTLCLFLIPTDESSASGRDNGLAKMVNPDVIRPEDAYVVYDNRFLWKTGLIFLMLASLCLGLGVYFVEIWSAKIHGSLPIPRKKADDYQ